MCCGGQQASVTMRGVMAGLREAGVALPGGFMPEIKNAVKMKFVGRQAGSITFLGKYRGGAQDPADQIANVDPADVDRLLRTGMWARVEPETKAEAKAPAKAEAETEAEAHTKAEAEAGGDDAEAPVGKATKKPKA